MVVVMNHRSPITVGRTSFALKTKIERGSNEFEDNHWQELTSKHGKGLSPYFRSGHLEVKYRVFVADKPPVPTDDPEPRPSEVSGHEASKAGPRVVTQSETKHEKAPVPVHTSAKQPNGDGGRTFEKAKPRTPDIIDAPETDEPLPRIEPKKSVKPKAKKTSAKKPKKTKKSGKGKKK